MSPMADAMRLVDREGRHMEMRSEFEKTRGQHPLRRYEDQMMMTGGNLALDTAQFGHIHPTVQCGSRIAARSHRIDLIFHQGDQRRYHYIAPSGNGRRHLIAQ